MVLWRNKMDAGTKELLDELEDKLKEYDKDIDYHLNKMTYFSKKKIVTKLAVDFLKGTV